MFRMMAIMCMWCARLKAEMGEGGLVTVCCGWCDWGVLERWVGMREVYLGVGGRLRCETP